MKKRIASLLVLFCLCLAMPVMAQDSSRLNELEEKIDKSEKKEARAQKRMERQRKKLERRENKVERQQRKIERRERKRNREQRKLERAQEKQQANPPGPSAYYLKSFPNKEMVFSYALRLTATKHKA